MRAEDNFLEILDTWKMSIGSTIPLPLIIFAGSSEELMDLSSVESCVCTGCCKSPHLCFIYLDTTCNCDEYCIEIAPTTCCKSNLTTCSIEVGHV